MEGNINWESPLNCHEAVKCTCILINKKRQVANSNVIYMFIKNKQKNINNIIA